MYYTRDQIDAAINEAESVARPLSPDSEQVTTTNKTLLTLIGVAKRCLEIEDEGEVP